MKKQFTTLALVAAAMGVTMTANAQNANVGIGTTTPDASAMLDVTSTTKGMLPPRMTTTQRDAITSPAVGLMVFNVTNNQLEINNGTTSAPVWSSATGANIYNGDGVLTGSRTVTLDTNTLTFNGTSGHIMQQGNTNGATYLAVKNANAGNGAISLLQLRNDGANFLNLFINSSTNTSNGGVNSATLRNDAGPLVLSGSGTNCSLTLNNTDGITYSTNGSTKMLFGINGNIATYSTSGNFLKNFSSGPMSLVGSNGGSELKVSATNGMEYLFGGAKQLQFDGVGNVTTYTTSGNFVKNTAGPMSLVGNNGGAEIKMSTLNGMEYIYNGTKQMQCDGTGNTTTYTASGNFVKNTAGPMSLVGNNGGAEVKVSTTNGMEYIYNGTRQLQLDGSGNITTTTTGGSFFKNTNGPISISANNGFSIVKVSQFAGLEYFYNGTKQTTIDGAGNVYSNGAYYNISDRRLKRNIKATNYGLSTVMKLSAKQYDVYKTTTVKNGKPVINENTLREHSLGFIAQDLYNVIPEAVHKPKNEANEIWSVDYTKLVPVLTQAIQEQQAQIEELKAEKAASAKAYAQLSEDLREMKQMLGLKTKIKGAKIAKR